MELGRKKDEEKSNYEIKEDEVFPSKSSAVCFEAAETVTVMDSLLYYAAVNGYKNLPASIADEDEDEVEDEKNMRVEWRNLKVDEEYYMRKTVCKSNILHLSIQLKHLTFAAKAARRFPQLISDVDADENNSLHVAAQIGDVNFVKMIVEVCRGWGRTKRGTHPSMWLLSMARSSSHVILWNFIPHLLVFVTALKKHPFISQYAIESTFENFIWNEPVVVQAMLGVRSLSGIPTKMIKEYTNTIGVIAALLATITFTAGFTVPGGLNSSNGTPLLMQSRAFQVFMVSDIIAMCLSMMVLFFLMWIMTINDEKRQVHLVDLTVFSLQGALFTTILAFMTGLYASVFPSTDWIAIFACVLCSLLILLIWFIPGFIHIYLWYPKVKTWCQHVGCLCNKNQNNGGPNGTCSKANKPTGHSQDFVSMNIEPNN